MLLEQMTKMALVIETGRSSDLCDRVFRFGQLARGPIEAQPAKVFAHCCPVVFLEAAREMCWMHSHNVRDFDYVKGVVKSPV